MKGLLGIGLIILGVVLGLYLGVWWGVVGGITQLINGITPSINAINIAWGIAKIFVLAPLFGWLSFLIFISIGVTILKDN